MSTNRRSAVKIGAVCAVGLALGVAAVPSLGSDATERDRAEARIARRLAGTWRLVSWIQRAADDTVTRPFGSDAVGKLTYTRGGHMWALVARRGVPKSIPDANWYTGTFRLDLARRTVVHRVEHSNISAWEGTDQPRRFRLSGNRLTLSVLPAEAGGPTGILTWRRAAPPRPR
jgi:hypothetical protein